MGDEGVMAGANCKRYLQNKILDRKRRRPNSALLEATDVDEQVVCDAPTRLRQTTRQSTQKPLIPAINSLSKAHKTDSITRITTTSSKKYLRSTKQENEQDYDTMSFTDTEKYDINPSKRYLENVNNHGLKSNDRDDYRNLERKQSADMERQDVKESLNHEECLNAKENEKDDNAKESHANFDGINENEYQTSFDCNAGNSIRQSSDLNENSHAPSSLYHKTAKKYNYEELGNVFFENHREISLVKDTKKTKHDHEVIKSTENDDEDADAQENRFNFDPTPSHELVHQNANDSPSKSHLNSSEEEQKPIFENELSHLSNSLCSENTSPLDVSCKISMQNSKQNFESNEESKMSLGEIVPTKTEENQKNLFESTNETMKSSLLSSTKHLQSTVDIGMPPGSPRDEQYRLYNAEDENHECAIKSSPTQLPPLNITSHTKQKTSSDSDNTTNFQNVCFQETSIKQDVCPDVLSSIATEANINYIREDETGPASNTQISFNHDCKDNNLKIEPTSLGQSIQSPIKEQHENNVTEKIQDNLENQPEPNHVQENSHFDKYLEKSSPHQQAQTQSNGSIPHEQQHEKDIIDAADKVYSEIEQQYHQQHRETTISTTYEQMIHNHQQQQHQNNPHEHEREELRQGRDNVADSLQQMQTLQHSMQQQLQSHYSAEQLYQLQQQQQEQHQQIHMQRHQMQKQEELQQQQQQQHQQHHNMTSNQQREHTQHPHLMDFLHPQHHHSVIGATHSPLHQQHQQHQLHEVYHDLMMEEFHEEHNTPYKLGLSPSTVKHENQDDGYETSAGDVLTPNSHASSTHSVTPQHHMQHGGVVTNIKCEEQHQQHGMRIQQTQHSTHAMNEQNQNLQQQELVPNESAANIVSRDHYHFMDDDINSANNNNLRNILTPPHSHTRSNQEAGAINGFMAMQSESSAPTNVNSTNDIYTLTNSSVHHHHIQNPPCLDTNSNTPSINAEHQHYTETTNEFVGREQAKSIPKRRGRKKKIPDGGLQPMLEGSNPNDANSMTGFTKIKERKKHDRFNGMSEEEVVKRILPDHLCDNLDIVIIGINPGLFAAYKGHHYAGPGNHFWKCLYLSGLTQEQMNADEDFKLLKYGIGFTNMVQRATKGSADLTRKEIKEGSRILLEKLQRFRPKIAVFNGKLIFEVFSGKKDFNFGRQPECVEGTDTFVWVMPSSSARCAQLPRAADKVPFYAALKKFRDYLNGLIPQIDQSECVFTEERIKQQCEQENYKNQQNHATTGTNDPTYQAVGISNANNPLQNNVGYSFDSESNPHGAGEGPGPPPPTPTADNNVSNNFMMSSLVGTNVEKKKRGRPKKIKGEEIIDPVTGNKIQVNRQMMGANNGDYTNILNLSIVPNSEMPKKKRGRPKKVKTHPDMLQNDIVQSASMLNQKPNIMSIQSLTSEIAQGSPHHMQGMQTNHQHVAMYSTPPPRQRNIYSPMASPMASPSLNCSYTTNTPPTQPHHDKLGLPSNGGRESSKPISSELVPPAHHQQNPIQDQNFGESPPPSSPNICTVDFEPPTGSAATSSIVSENVNSDLSTMHQRLQSNHQRSRFNSPISGEATPDHNGSDHFQQWLSPQPNHNIHSPGAATTMFVNSPQQPSLNYHDQQQQQQMQSIQQQQQQSQHQDIHSQWPLRHQGRYEDLANSPYLLSSQVHQTHSHNQANHNHQSQQGSSDVARKSLSGLESLVDQIPTISESESIALSSAAAVNAQVAAAAAVENRLQGMQNSALGDSRVGDDSHFASITGSQNLLTASNSPSSAPTNNQIQQSNSTSSLLNSNFSVSNLAASSATSNNNNSNSHESYGLPPNTRSLANPNAYHHSNLMAAAVLAAAAVNTPTNLTTPSAAAAASSNNHHASMYMDPHAHLTTHVPVNSIYPSAVPPSHHHHHSGVAAHHHHHHAAVHYGSAQHTAADYVTSNNPYAAAQNTVTTSHTLHMPSPNYPYGYPASSTQSNYSAYPHSHHANHHHGHPHAHHSAHHLAMFDRLKSSDITGYSTGF